MCFFKYYVKSTKKNQQVQQQKYVVILSASFTYKKPEI